MCVFFDTLFVFTIFLTPCILIYYFTFCIFLVSCGFDITVTLQGFPDILLFYMQHLMFDFPFIFFSYTVLLILSYHRISFSLPVLSFLDIRVFFFEDSNLYSALLTITLFFNKHFRALFALTVQWTFINCNGKYRVIG